MEERKDFQKVGKCWDLEPGWGGELMGVVRYWLCLRFSVCKVGGHDGDPFSPLCCLGPPPLPGPAFCVSPTFFSGVPRPSPPHRRHSRPGRSGKHSVVCSRLSGSSVPQMWAEWAVAGRARAGGWGDYVPPKSYPSAGHTAGEAAGGTHRQAEGPPRQMGETLSCSQPSQGSLVPLE